MDDLRMNRLFEHIDKMDKDLVSMLENYKNYSEQKMSTVCVLCSDNKLRAEVDKVFTIRENILVNVIVTSEDIATDDKYKAMLCDAVVVCTRAKNIAPKGLYDMVKHISQLDKQVFVILAGWESIERNEKMAKSRAERVSVEFDSARIMDVTNVFNMSCEGFKNWEDAFNSLGLYFCEKYEALHLEQDEKIYNYLMRYIDDFYTNARTKINRESAILNNAEKIAMAKQDYYVVRFSNIAVSVQDVVDTIRNSLEDVSYYDIVDDDKNESLTDKYSRNGSEAQKYAKFFLTNEYKKRVDKLKNNSNEKVKTDNETCVAECVNEMNALADDLLKLTYIPGGMVDKFRTICNETEELEKIVKRYELSSKILLENVTDRIPAKVGEYRYEMKYSVEVRDKGKEFWGITKSAIKDLLSEERESEPTDDSTDEKRIDLIEENIGNEDDDAMMLDKFQNDVEQLIFYSRNACGEMAQDCAKNIKQDMEKFANSILKIYFGNIIKEIESMQNEMSKILEEYYLE